jgi:hypothetical protein
MYTMDYVLLTTSKNLVDSIRIRYFIVICGSGEHPCSQGLSLGNYMYTKSWSSRAYLRWYQIMSLKQKTLDCLLGWSRGVTRLEIAM